MLEQVAHKVKGLPDRARCWGKYPLVYRAGAGWSHRRHGELSLLVAIVGRYLHVLALQVRGMRTSAVLYASSTGQLGGHVSLFEILV
jgi:hypothetical protein